MLQGPQVNLTFRWVTQLFGSCPLAGAMCPCSALVRARFSRTGSSSGGTLEIFNGSAIGESSSFCQSGCVSWDTPCLILGTNAATVVGVHPFLAVHSSIKGSCSLDQGLALATVAAEPFPKKLLNDLTPGFFWEVNNAMFYLSRDTV